MLLDAGIEDMRIGPSNPVRFRRPPSTARTETVGHRQAAYVRAVTARVFHQHPANYGDVAMYQMAGERIFLVSDPRLVKDILVTTTRIS